jgi:protein-tyrosine phosphatase
MSTSIEFTPKYPITSERPFRVLFVCLGNICRSPTAEGIFQHLVNERGLQSFFEIDSAGTSGWHEGEPANSKSRATAEKHGVKLLTRSRALKPFYLGYYDLILAMDSQNFRDITSLAHNDDHKSRIYRMRDFDPDESGDVPDPYYDALEGFEHVFRILDRSSRKLLDDLVNHIETS